MFSKYENFYHKVVFYYTLAFAVYTLFGRFTWLHALVEYTINSYMYILAGLFGFLLFAFDFIFYRNYRKMKYYPLYLAFILCAAISSALNYKYGIRSNLTTLIWLCVQMILFTSMGHGFTRETYRRWLTYFFVISGSIWGFASLVSLYQYLFVRGYRIFMNSRWIRQSLVENRLFGVFIDPNLGAFVSFVVIWGMIYLMICYPKKPVRIAGVINCVIQTLYIVLSGSRSTEVCMIVSLSYALIYWLKCREKKKPVTQTVLRILRYLAVPILCFGIIWEGFSLLRTGISEVAYLLLPEIHSGTDELVRTDIEEDSSNNRIEIWKGYLYLMKDKPVFGVSPRNAWQYADTEHPESYLAEHHYDVHNAYVAVLACMGVVGFAILILIIGCILRAVLPRALSVETMNITYFIALQLILNIAVFIFFYPGIFFTNGIDTLLFWPAIGYVLQDIRPKNSSDK